MREGLVGRRHLVDVIAFLENVALTLERVDDFGGDGGRHAHTVARASELRRPAERKRQLAVRGDRHGMGMPAAVAAEIIDAFQGQGNVIKKRDDVHKMAQANKAFAHYAW